MPYKHSIIPCIPPASKRGLLEFAKATVDTIVLPEAFLTLSNMLGQAILCTPENPDCDTSSALYLGGGIYLLFELSQLSITLCWSKASDHSRMKQYAENILTVLKDYGRSIQSNFLFIFLVMMRIAGVISVAIHEDDQAEQGEISNLAFGVIIGTAIGVATLSTKEILDKVKAIAIKKEWIKPTIKEAMLADQEPHRRGSTVTFSTIYSLLAGIPAAAEAQFGLLAYELLYEAISKHSIVYTPIGRVLRWAPLLGTYGIVSTCNGFKQFSGSSSTLQTAEKVGAIVKCLFLFLPLALSTTDYFAVFPALTALMMMTSLLMRLLEHRPSLSPLNSNEVEQGKLTVLNDNPHYESINSP